MIVEKNGKIYTVRENPKSWTVKIDIENVSVSYNVSKDDCKTFDELQGFISGSDLF